MFVGCSNGLLPGNRRKLHPTNRAGLAAPCDRGDRTEARKLMVEMFDLVLPEKVSEEVVQKYVKLIYGPTTKELVQMVMPFDTRSEVTTLTLDKGWVTEACRGCKTPSGGAPPG
jgi:hypothetical protein